MQDLIKLTLIGAALFAIGWFVSFQYDPYRVCVDHPEADLKKDFYLCEPGGFTLEKGTRLERPADDRFPWEKNGDVIIGTENPRKRYKQQQNQIQEDLNSFKCKPEFYELSDSEMLKLTQKEIDSYCTPKGSKPKIVAPETLPDSSTKEL